jgi:hypothetical protein
MNFTSKSALSASQKPATINPVENSNNFFHNSRGGDMMVISGYKAYRGIVRETLMKKI